MIEALYVVSVAGAVVLSAIGWVVPAVFCAGVATGVVFRPQLMRAWSRLRGA